MSNVSNTRSPGLTTDDKDVTPKTPTTSYFPRRRLVLSNEDKAGIAKVAAKAKDKAVSDKAASDKAAFDKAASDKAAAKVFATKAIEASATIKYRRPKPKQPPNKIAEDN